MFLSCSSAEGYWNDGSWAGWQHVWASSSDPLIQQSDNTCIARNGDQGSGAYAHITCCDTMDSDVELSCIAVYAANSRVNPTLYYDTKSVSVECPSDGEYFMTSCSGAYVVEIMFILTSVNIHILYPSTQEWVEWHHRSQD